MWSCFESRDSGLETRDSKKAEVELTTRAGTPRSFASGSQVSISMMELRPRVAEFRIPSPDGSTA